MELSYFEHIRTLRANSIALGYVVTSQGYVVTLNITVDADVDV